MQEAGGMMENAFILNPGLTISSMQTDDHGLSV